MFPTGKNISECLLNYRTCNNLLFSISCSTGVLYLPWGYDLAMWGSTLMYLVTYKWGGHVWQIPLLGTEWTCGHFLEYLLHISACTNLPMVFYNIYRSYADKTGKMRSFKENTRPLIPLFIFFGVCLMWIHYSPNNIIETDPRALYAVTGTIFSNISCRLIISQMSNTRCEKFNHMIPYLIASFIGSLLFPRIERILLYAMLIYSTLAHFHFGAGVVNEMCVYFNRICFSVKMRSVKDEK